MVVVVGDGVGGGGHRCYTREVATQDRRILQDERQTNFGDIGSNGEQINISALYISNFDHLKECVVWFPS